MANSVFVAPGVDQAIGGKIVSYNGITTAGYGVPVVVGRGRATAQTASAGAVATYTVGASDGSFIVFANVLVTASTTHSFQIQCAYTDEGNTARTLLLTFELVAASAVSAVVNANGTVPYHGLSHQIRAKAGTTITIQTQAAGTYTSVTYNVEGTIVQVA